MSEYTCVNVEEAVKLLESGTKPYDIRDETSFEQGHIPGALHLDRPGLFELAEEADPNQSYLIYCYKGKSSQMAAEMLADEGFSQVYSLNGGFDEWRSTYPEKVES